MSKVDWIVITLLGAFMFFCFWMGSRSWFFIAGICASVVSAIVVGHGLKGKEQQNHEKSWDDFLNKIQDETRMPENNRKHKNLIKSEVAVHHNMF